MGFSMPVKLDECSLYFAKSGILISDFVQNERAFNLIAVSCGQARIKNAHEEFSIREGQLFVAFPFESVSVEKIGSDTLKLDHVVFSVNSGKYRQVLEGIKISEISQNRVFENKDLCGVVRSLCREVKVSDSKELLSLLCSQIIVYVLRSFKDSVGDVDLYKQENAGVGMCTKVMNYIDSRIYSIKNLSEVADALGYNYCYISSVFRKTTGTTLNRYFLSARMEHAKKLLEEEGYTATKTAKVLGYSSVFSFSKAFKDFYGTSPGKHKTVYSQTENGN